jgi:alpha-D-xyloside xylohydrolase
VAWVGDNRRDWVGLEDALDHIFRSARSGYVVVGSDLGGYLNVNDLDVLEEVPFSQETFARWTGVAAMTPFMQLHGRANLTPWTMPVRADETVVLYRYWAQLHHEMVPFWYSLAESAYAGGPAPLLPIGDQAAWKGDYRYLIGEAFLVAPILDDTGVRDVPLPAGSRWLDWWDLTGPPQDGGQTLPQVDVGTQARIPMYLKEGAIVPLEVDGALTGFGAIASKDAAMILLWPGPIGTEFTRYDADDQTTRIEAKTGSVTLSRTPAPVTLQIRVDAAPTSVSLDQAPLGAASDRNALATLERGYFADPSGRLVFVKLPASDAAQSVRLE